MYPEISEAERFPRITPKGLALLRSMRQHPHAPVWNWPNGEQLNEAGLATVQSFATRLMEAMHRQHEDLTWLRDFTEFCARDVPFYRTRCQQYGLLGASFTDWPSIHREDLAPRVWEFVPDSMSLDELIVFSTSGTTGHPTRMLSHPATAACGVPLIEAALSRNNVTLPRGPEHVAITNVAAYRGAYTTAIVVSYLNEAGCVRINLDQSAWRNASDCVAYMNHWHAPVWLGDPLAYASMQSISIDHAPQAIVSSIMRLSDAFANNLKKQYGCPVIDLYAMTEVGIVAMRTEIGHEILPHDLYVEILGPNDEPLPDGARGEVTVTCARNPFMPLVRYRTGDFASLMKVNGRRVLIDLEGRSPVLFPLPSGRLVHSMEVTRLMRRYPLLQYRLHQESDGTFRFGHRGHVDLLALRRELAELLELQNSPSSLEFSELNDVQTTGYKVIEYRSALAADVLP